MNSLHKRFAKKYLPDSQSGGGVPVSRKFARIDGVRFPLVESIDTLCASIESEGRGVLRFRSITYSQVISTLVQRLEERYGRDSGQYRDSIPSPLMCAGCLWEFPQSYKLSLQMPEAFGGNVFGATTGFDAFGKSGLCSLCGCDESLLVYEYFPCEKITPQDVQLIRRYWQAEARAWWQNQGQRQTGAVCDYCSVADIAQNQGYLNGTYLLCENCLNSVLLANGLQMLRNDPHAYGMALLRKTRQFRG